MKTKSIGIRLVTQPFEAAVAMLLMITGVAELAGWAQPGPKTALLPSWEITGLNVLTFITGLFILIGILFGWRRFELSGLFFLLAIFVIQLVVFAAYFGVNKDLAVTIVFDMAVIWAAIVRIAHILRGTTLVWIRGDHDLGL